MELLQLLLQGAEPGLEPTGGQQRRLAQLLRHLERRLGEQLRAAVHLKSATKACGKRKGHHNTGLIKT